MDEYDYEWPYMMGDDDDFYGWDGPEWDVD